MNKSPADSARGEFDGPMTLLRPWILRLAVAIIVAVLGIFVVASTTPPPPVMSLVGVEPSGIFDDAGKEMSLATVSIRNPNTGRTSGQSLYIKAGGIPVEAKFADHWIRLESTFEHLGPCLLYASTSHETLILAPAETESLRICVKFAGPTLTGGRLARLAEQLPRWIRFRLPAKFWRFAGYAQYGPGSDWREVSLELPQPILGTKHISQENRNTQ